MPIRVTDYLSLDREMFNATGAFDTILDVDTKLYISPLLLHHINILELANSYQNIQDYFKNILRLLRVSKYKEDVAWREAAKRLRFREPQWLPLGYSGKGTAGRGIGKHIQVKLTDTAKEIVDMGLEDPEIFELIGVIEDNIGPDLISDMIGNIILKDLLNCSVRVFAHLEIPPERLNCYKYSGDEFFLPTYSDKEKRIPIVLVPRDILKPLPIMTSWDDVDDVAAKCHEIRRQMNEIIGAAWSTVKTTDKKDALRGILLQDPDLFRELIADYRQAPPENYDFLEDEAGFVSWLDAARKYATQYPIDLISDSVSTPEQVLDIVLKICHKFKYLVEHNGLNKELYNEKTLYPRREETSQKLLYAIADVYCEVHNIELTRESDAGRGPVDFKFSSGYKSRVLIEIKLSKNDIIKGYKKQLAVYQESEKAKYAVFLVIIVSDDMSKIDSIQQLVASLKEKSEPCPALVIIDGRMKPSASNV
jgi:hypothetical protein